MSSCKHGFESVDCNVCAREQREANIRAEGYKQGVEAAAAAVVEWDGDHDLADRLKGELLHLPCNAKDWDAGGDQLTCQRPRPCAEHPREPDGTLKSWKAPPEPAAVERQELEAMCAWDEGGAAGDGDVDCNCVRTFSPHAVDCPVRGRQ